MSISKNNLALGLSVDNANNIINQDTVDFSLISLLPNGRVEARNLWKFLESKQEFANWIKNLVEEYGFEQGKEVFDKIIKNPLGGRPLQDYELTVDCAKEICMISRTEKGKQARKYFIAMEEKAKNNQIALSEETMLTKLFPDTDKNLITLTAQTIREAQTLRLESKEKSNQIIKLANDVQETRETLAKNYKTIMARNKADIGNSINMLVRKHFASDKNYKNAHEKSWKAYKRDTGISYAGASNSSYEEKVSFLNYLTTL